VDEISDRFHVKGVAQMGDGSLEEGPNSLRPRPRAQMHCQVSLCPRDGGGVLRIEYFLSFGMRQLRDCASFGPGSCDVVCAHVRSLWRRRRPERWEVSLLELERRSVVDVVFSCL
jgi:hypothetical protein